MRYVAIFCTLFFSYLPTEGQLLPDSLVTQYKSANSDAGKSRKLSTCLYSLKGESDSQIRETMEILAWFKTGK